MNALAWVVLFVFAVVTGVVACVSLVAPRPDDILTAIASALASLFVLVAISYISVRAGRADTTIAAAFIALGASIGGFGMGAALILPALRRVGADRTPASDAAPDDGLLHVIVLANVEPTRYDPRAVADSFEEMDEVGVTLPPDAVRVFAFVAEKARYRSIGGTSPGREEVAETLEQVREAIGSRCGPSKVHAAFCRPPGTLVETVAAIHREGGRRFAVVTLSAAEYHQFARAKRQLAAAGIAGVRVADASPLWSSETLPHHVAARALHALDGEVAETDGVVVCLPGRPPALDQAAPEAVEHETFFAERVRRALETAGLAPAHLRTAWLDWQDPDVIETVRHLAAVGCERIVVVPAAWPVEDLETLVDLEVSAAEAASSAGAWVATAPAWGSPPVVGEAVADAACAVLDELEDPGR